MKSPLILMYIKRQTFIAPTSYARFLQPEGRSVALQCTFRSKNVQRSTLLSATPLTLGIAHASMALLSLNRGVQRIRVLDQQLQVPYQPRCPRTS
ncbi:hypothetical protein SAMN06298211_10440 [Prevotellaceae bacterium MN60]|nr:hypothetical protein SAMN06298211_10440 [Prevotellaceae bacterium MN60]